MPASFVKWQLLLLLLLGFSNYTFGQNDTSYYESYSSQITGRFYFSQKYTSLVIDHENDNLDLTYRPNTTLNMGIGASYDWFTLNLAYGFGFLNPDEHKGKTKYLDLQAHLYGQKLNLDLFGEFYKGFYLSPKGKAVNDNSYYQRPDLKVTELGASVQYIFNDEKISFKAASIQTQRQKKSAGSLLIGAELYFGIVKSDSSIFPSLLYTDSLRLNQANFIEIGPNIGYAYTLVFLKNFYITASVAANVDYSITNYYDNAGKDHHSGISPNAMVRFFAGYNSARSAISLTFTDNKVALASENKSRATIKTGNFRINFVRRFVPGPKTARFLKRTPLFK